MIDSGDFMNIEFKEFSLYDRGILYNQLVNAYSFNGEWKKCFEKDWHEYDSFFFDNLKFTDECGFVTVLDGVPIGHISWDPRNLVEYVVIGHNCIIEEYKGKGYGKIQLQEAVRRIKEYDGIKKIIVTTNTSLISARYNYESVGFVLKEKRVNTDFEAFGDYLDYEFVVKNN